MERTDSHQYFNRLQPQGQVYVGEDGRFNYIPLQDLSSQQAPQAAPPSAPHPAYVCQPPVMMAPVLTPELYHIKAERERFAWWVKVSSSLLLVFSVLEIIGDTLSAFGPHHYRSPLSIVSNYVVYIFMLVVAVKGFKAAKLQTTRSTYLYKKLLIALMIVMVVFYVVSMLVFGLGHHGKRHHRESRSLREDHRHDDDEDCERHHRHDDDESEEDEKDEIDEEDRDRHHHGDHIFIDGMVIMGNVAIFLLASIFLVYVIKTCCEGF